MITKAMAMLFMYCCACTNAFSQSYFYNNSYYDNDFLFEVNASIGAMNCFTDLGGRANEGKGFIKDLNIPFTKLCGGAGAAFVYRYMIGVRFALNAGTIEASDNILRHDKSAGGVNRYKRNLHFRSDIQELLLLTEVYPFTILGAFREKHSRLLPYLTGGTGMFWFNPQTYINGARVNLQPLHTEGQGFDEYPDRQVYKLNQVNFPVGCGFKYELSPLCNLRLEMLYRITTTDYLDDVSTRYIDPAYFKKYLSPGNAGLAVLLHDRQSEINSQHTTIPGSIRGRNSRNDGYFAIQLNAGLILGRQRR